MGRISNSDKAYKERELLAISKMSNRELLDETLSLAGGDDYDGYFTKLGAWKCSVLTIELEKRLENWLKEN